MRRMNAIDWAAFALVVIGGLNWGLVGLFKYDLVAEIFGELSGVSRVIYTLVGIATVYLLFSAYTRESSAPRM